MGFLLALIPAPYQLLAKGIASVFLIIALWAAWHAFTGHYVDIGKAELQPQIDSLKTTNTELIKAYHELEQKLKEQNAAVNDLKVAGDKMKAQGASALAEANKRATNLQNQTKWLSEQLAKPDIQQKTCNDALKEWRAQP